MNSNDEYNFRKERVAILVHVFYPQYWSDLLNCIRNFEFVYGEHKVQTYVTVSESITDVDFIASVQKDVASAIIRKVPNRGYDVAPFFFVLNLISLDDFDYVVKIHTKRDVDCYVNFRPLHGGEFRAACLAFCSQRYAVESLCHAFNSQPDVGMIASSRMIDPSGYGSCRDPWKNASVLQEVGIKCKSYAMILGTMFVVRSKLLKPVWRRYSFDDFPPTCISNAHHEYGRAILWEGAFGMMIIAQGYRIADGFSSAFVGKLSFCFWAIVFRGIRNVMTTIRRVQKAVCRGTFEEQ